MHIKKSDPLLNYLDYLVFWLKDKLKESGLNGFVVAISGGVDSALVACLAKKAAPETSYFFTFPIDDMGEDLVDAKQLARENSFKLEVFDLSKSFETTKEILNLKNKLSIINLKTRLRMSSLYALAQQRGCLVLGTDNFSELYLGYFTKFGDGACDLMPISRLTKSQVYQAAKLLGISQKITNKLPTAALFPGQTDEAELGFKYSDFEDFLLGVRQNKALKKKIIQQINSTKHKRVLPQRPLPFQLNQSLMFHSLEQEIGVND